MDKSNMGDTVMEREYDAELNSWIVEDVSDEEVIIWGEIQGDVYGRFLNGTRIHTSGIKKGTPILEGLVVTTRNSKYLLGKPLTMPDNMKEDSERMH